MDSKILKKHSIRFLKILGEKLFLNDSTVPTFTESFKSKLEQLGSVSEQIYKLYITLNSSTLVTAEERGAPARKISKEIVTIIIGNINYR